jgi:hypothetical protein
MNRDKPQLETRRITISIRECATDCMFFNVSTLESPFLRSIVLTGIIGAPVVGGCDAAGARPSADQVSLRGSYARVF